MQRQSSPETPLQLIWGFPSNGPMCPKSEVLISVWAIDGSLRTYSIVQSDASRVDD